MAETIDEHSAKTHLLSLLHRVARREEIVILRAGKPVARLVPIGSAERPLGFVKATIDDAFFEPLPEDELVAWHQSGTMTASRKECDEVAARHRHSSVAPG